MKNTINKKGQSSYSIQFLVRILMITVVIGGISLAIFIFYTKPIDLRQEEIFSINNNLAECIQNDLQLLYGETTQNLEECSDYDKENTGTIIYLENKEIKFGKIAIYEICSQPRRIDSNVLCYKTDYVFLDNGDLKKMSILTGLSKISLNTK